MKKLIFLAFFLVPNIACASPALQWWQCREHLIESQTVRQACVRMVNFYHSEFYGSDILPDVTVHDKSTDPIAAAPDEWFERFKACEQTVAIEDVEFYNCRVLLNSLVQ